MHGDQRGGSPETVLIVDDDPAMRDAMRLVLEDDGYHVALAENGLDALQWLAANALPCVILMDLMMPIMDGFQLWAELQSHPVLSRIPVLVLSAGAAAHAHALGTAAVLTKPVELDTLLALVESHCPAGRRPD